MFFFLSSLPGSKKHEQDSQVLNGSARMRSTGTWQPQSSQYVVRTSRNVVAQEQAELLRLVQDPGYVVGFVWASKQKGRVLLIQN